ncbi:hypothetical protein [Corynebacterium sp. 335C]
MIFQPDNSRTNRAAQAEDRARRLVQEILDREERVRTNLASEDVDPWEMRFIVDDSIHDGAIALWRSEATRARRLLRRYSIQSGYRERMRDVERRIDSLLLLAESLEETWDAAAAASRALSTAEARDAEAFKAERARQNDAREAKRARDARREARRRELLRKAENVGSDVLRRSVDAGRDALDKLPNLRAGAVRNLNPFRGRDDEPREVRKATARDLRKEPPLPED